MKPITIHQTLASMRWICIWVLIYSQLSFFSIDVAAQEPQTNPSETPVTVAQEPTAVSTPTPAPTWTPGPGPTATPGGGSAPTPTPTNVSGATPTGRLVDFRVDDDSINNGDCVQFSWVIRGDIDRVEFDKKDDNKDPLLVSDQADREECPTEDSTYKLIARWLDGTRTDREIEINVHTGSDGGSGGSSGSGGSGSTTSTDGAGEFIPVTPILITTGTPTPQSVAVAPVATQITPVQQAVYDGAPGSQPAAPAGLLGSVHTLPETGAFPAQPISPQNNLAIPQPHWMFWLVSVGGMLLFGSLGIALVLLITVQTQRPGKS